ncbi:MAG: DNA-processing protein DprA [Clostridia bacterium]|nr:DNA-processing protein DprA [Clostridia bacterium]
MIKINYTNKEYPERLLKINKRPNEIYVKGNMSLLNSFGIAVIGTRCPTSYGKRMCNRFTKELVQYGITIISGLANGIDSIAHKTCLENGGNTIAVLPNGFNYIYPKENENLYKNILASNGAVVTEYSINEKAESKKFLERNRIVAGIAVGTLVIEAGYRSGTSVTARITKEQEKPVFSIPSSLENEKGITCNLIIQNGAKLVTCVEDILEEFENHKFEKKEIQNSDIFVDEELKDLYNVLTYKPQHINDIAKKLTCDIKEISYKLMMLELEEKIIELPGKNFIRK